MAGESTAVYPTANSFVDKTAAGTFIPNLWSDEVIAAYQKTLKMAPLVKRMPMIGKKGDTINVPKPVRGAAAAKAEATAVTIQANLESNKALTIDRHFEYSRLIEDIVDVQALNSLRKFYTDDAGYALALRVDTDLLNMGTAFGNGTKTFSPTVTGTSWINTNSFYFDTSASGNLATYAADTVEATDIFSDAGFRQAIKKLDDADVPMDNRVLVVPPACRKVIMGIDRYVSSDFQDTRTVQSGLIGSIYGVDIYVSSNCPVVETDANNTHASGTADARACLFFHKDAIVLLEQMSVRTQTQYKQEYLADLFTADTIYGCEVYRPEAGLVLICADV